MAHGDIVARVHGFLDQDHAARDMLSRKAVNVRQLARWLIQTQAWDVGEHAVVSACRRYPSTRPAHQSFGTARRALGRCRLSTRSHMAAAALANTPNVQRLLPRMFKLVDLLKGERLRIISNEHGFKVLLDEANLAKLVSLVGRAAVLEQRTGLTEIALSFPLADRSTPGILALVYSALGAEGINVVEVVEGVAQHNVWIDETDAIRAYNSLAALTSEGTTARTPRASHATKNGKGV